MGSGTTAHALAEVGVLNGDLADDEDVTIHITTADGTAKGMILREPFCQFASFLFLQLVLTMIQ